MRIRLNGQSPVLSNTEIRYAFNWFAESLMGAADQVHTTVNIRDDMPGMHCASMRPVPGKISTNFVVALNTRVLKKPRQLLLAAAHETVHIWQYATSAIMPSKATTYWRDMHLNENEFRYSELPWELEAYRMEGQLYSAYIDHLMHRAPKQCTSRTAEVVRGSKWFTVVMMCGGKVQMAIPARDMEAAETLIERWLTHGTVAFVG